MVRKGTPAEIERQPVKVLPGRLSLFDDPDPNWLSKKLAQERAELDATRLRDKQHSEQFAARFLTGEALEAWRKSNSVQLPFPDSDDDIDDLRDEEEDNS